MATGLPTSMWNNAVIESLEVDVAAMTAWYTECDHPWDVTFPADWNLRLGVRVLTSPERTTAEEPQRHGRQLRLMTINELFRRLEVPGRADASSAVRLARLGCCTERFSLAT
jgi:hypothetical protein